MQPVEIPPKSSSVGVDLGIKTFAATSDGRSYRSPDYHQLYRRIGQLQKRLARGVKGSRRREQTRLRIAKLHNRISDFKLSTKLMVENQAVVLEDLNVRGMLKNRKLSKAISR